LKIVGFLSGTTYAKNNSYSARKRSHLSRMYNKLLNNKSFHEYSAANRDLSPVEKLGKEIFEDLNLSANKNQACNSCHNSTAKFADPDNTLAPDARPVSQGSEPIFFGGRNAPTATYAAFSPRFHWNTSDALFIGGIFWDGRASGQPTAATATGPELDRTDPTGDPLADQAKGPFLNPVEMRLTTLEDVVDTVLASKSGKLFLKIYGKEIYDTTGLNVPLAYNKIAEAIAAFEATMEFNKFSSRFDAFVREQGGDVS
jgi:cytochrome c peroxidase